MVQYIKKLVRLLQVEHHLYNAYLLHLGVVERSNKNVDTIYENNLI